MTRTTVLSETRHSCRPDASSGSARGPMVRHVPERDSRAISSRMPRAIIARYSSFERDPNGATHAAEGLGDCQRLGWQNGTRDQAPSLFPGRRDGRCLMHVQRHYLVVRFMRSAPWCESSDFDNSMVAARGCSQYVAFEASCSVDLVQ